MDGKVNITPQIYCMVFFVLRPRITQLEPATSDLVGQVEAEGTDESCPSDIFEDHKWQSRECSYRKSQKADNQTIF
jgi:hypothetical protein